MSESFSVGEIAIYARPDSPYFGTEVKIWAPLGNRIAGIDWVTGERSIPYVGYGIEVPGLGRRGSRPEWLRKRRLPPDWVTLCKLNEVKREEPAHV